jgi:hypothetical protein
MLLVLTFAIDGPPAGFATGGIDLGGTSLLGAHIRAMHISFVTRPRADCLQNAVEGLKGLSGARAKSLGCAVTAVFA